MSDRGNKALRLFDRYIGIPLVFILGLFKKRTKKPGEVKKVAILATAAIGDTLLISAVIKDLLKALPDIELSLYCGKSNYSTFEMALPEVKAVQIPVGNPFKAIKKIRENNFDILLDFGPWPRINSLISFYTKAKYKVGFKSIGQHRHWVYNKVIDHRNDCHEIENLRRILAVFNIEGSSVPKLGEHAPKIDDKYIVVHMFPSGYKAHYKEWSDSNWVKLIDGITDNGVKVYLTGAPKDIDASNRIVKKCQRVELIKSLAGKTNLQEAGVILKEALKVVSVNTGIMHMAAAYNCPVVALHGPTSPLRWGPLCDNKINFCGTSKGAGKLHLGFEYVLDDPNSLDTIDYKEVLKATLKGVVNET